MTTATKAPPRPKAPPATSPIKPTDTSATSNAPPVSATPPAGSTQAPDKPKRTRSAMSSEHRLMILLAGIIAAFDAAKLAVDSPLGQAVEPARTLVKETQDKIITPTKNRLTELTKELQAATADPARINAATVIELSKEMERLQKKLKTVQA